MIKEILEEGYRHLQLKETERNKTKIGMYRGGSGGCYTDGKFYGTCPRKALFRFKGLETKTSFSDSLNFVSGIYHEENLVNLLLANPKVIKVERWDVPNHYLPSDPRIVVHEESIEFDIDGIQFSGRPDIVFTLDTGERILIEAKATVSENKAIESSDTPFLYAVCQAAMYRLVLDKNMTTYVVYGNYSNFNKFEFKKIPSDKRKKNIIYNEFPKGTYVKVPCNIHEYQILFSDTGIIHVKDSVGNITETPLTTSGLIDYYKEIGSCIKGHNLPDRRQEIELYGKPKYSECTYCEEYKEWCDGYDKMAIDFDGVISGITRELTPKIKI